MKEEIEFIKQKILDEYKDVVDLIIIYGSYARGNYNEFSDVDIIVLVNADKRYSGITSLPWIFRYKNVIIDCWEGIWSHLEENLESIKNSYFLFPIGGILDCKVHYSRDEDTLMKLRKLQEEIANVIADEKENMKLLEKHYTLAEGIYGIQKAQRRNDLPSARMCIWRCIFHMITALARLNGTYYKYNWGKNLSEAYNLKLLPNDFKTRVDFLIQTDNIPKALDTIYQLDEELRELIKTKTTDVLQVTRAEKDIDDEYNGIIEYLNKMRASCKKHNLSTLSYEASELQLMTAELIAYLEKTIDRGEQYIPTSITKVDYNSLGLPDLSPIITKGDFEEMEVAINLFEEQIDLYMREKSSIQNIQNMKGLQDAILKKITAHKDNLV